MKASKKKSESIMKRLFLLFVLLSGVGRVLITASCPNANIREQVILQATLIDVNPTPGNGERPRGPIEPPCVYLDGYSLDMSSVSFDTILQLIDEDGEVVYSTFVPQNTLSVELPSNLSGEYELQIIHDNLCFYGVITL